MKVLLSRNKSTEQQYNLQQGSYLIGRSSRCDIVLEGKKISREHARLTVKKTSYSFEDLESSIGTFLNGKKITKVSFGNNRVFQIGQYELTVIPSEGSGKRSLLKIDDLGGLAAICRRPLACIVLLQVLLVFPAIIAVWLFLSAQYHDFIDAREKERAVLIATSLVRSDVEQLVSSMSADQLFPEKEREAGVTAIILTDRLGNVKYPVDQLVEQVDYPSLIRSLMSRKLEMTNLSDRQLRICNPVIQQGQLSGFVIVDYHMRPVRAITGTGGWFVFLGLVCIVVLVIFSGVLLRYLILFPWKELARKVALSLEKGDDRIDLPDSYDELTDMKRLFERLLVRAGKNRPLSDYHGDRGKSSDPPTENKSGSAGVSPQLSAVKPDLTGDHSPACIIDRNTGQLIDYTKRFAQLIPVDTENSNHVIELFQESGAVEGVLELLKQGTGSVACTIEEKEMSLSGEPVKGNETYISIVIKEDDK